MKPRDKLLAILSVLYVLTLFCGCLGGESDDVPFSTFSTDIGDVIIDIPYDLEPNKMSSGTMLLLAKPGTDKPIVGINLQDTWGYDFETVAGFYVGEGKTYTETTTNDGKRMLFYVFDGGRNLEDKPLYEYYAFIDHISDKDVVIEINSNSEIVLDGEVLAEFGTDEFKNICRSFAFVS